MGLCLSHSVVDEGKGFYWLDYCNATLEGWVLSKNTTLDICIDFTSLEVEGSSTDSSWVIVEVAIIEIQSACLIIGHSWWNISNSTLWREAVSELGILNRSWESIIEVENSSQVSKDIRIGAIINWYTGYIFLSFGTTKNWINSSIGITNVLINRISICEVRVFKQVKSTI